jgi:hypothetical protein
MPAPVASGGSDRRVGLAPTGKAPPCHGARGLPTFGELGDFLTWFTMKSKKNMEMSVITELTNYNHMLLITLFCDSLDGVC